MLGASAENLQILLMVVTMSLAFWLQKGAVIGKVWLSYEDIPCSRSKIWLDTVPEF